MSNRKIVLASASPRRSELMRMLGFQDVVVHPAVGEERPPEGATPEETVMVLSRAKAEEVAAAEDKDALVIAADTIVWLDRTILGKPHSEEDAFRMLSQLSGREHEVYTGVTLMDRDGELCEAECSKVYFRTLSEEEIRHYITTGEPMDKAGAYGAQGLGALFVRGIEGDFFNVMGLPVCHLGQMLAKKGVPIL